MDIKEYNNCLNNYVVNTSARLNIKSDFNINHFYLSKAVTKQERKTQACGTNLQNIAESVQWQVKYLLCNLTAKKNLKPCSEEIHKVLQLSGNKFDHLLIQIPLELLDVKDPKIQNGGKDQAKVHFLSQEISRLNPQPSFLHQVPLAFQNLQITALSDFILDLFKCVKLQIHEQIIFLIALCQTTNETYRQEAIKVLKLKLNEYYKSGKPQPLPSYSAHKLLLMLLNSPDFSEDIMSRAPNFQVNPLQAQNGHITDLADLLLDCEPSISCSYPALQAICGDYKDKEMGESKIADLLIKLANSTNNYTESKKDSKINGVAMSSLVTAEAKEWHMDNLAKVLRETFNKTNWEKVAEAFDKPITVTSLKAFKFLITLYNKCKQNSFPVMVLLKPWRNVDSQVTFIEFSLQTQDSELISFKDTTRKQAIIDAMQGMKPSASSFLPTWCSIDLVERLIDLSDSRNYMRIKELFEVPQKNCPEYLLLTIAQTEPKGGTFLLDELYGTLLPMFLGNHINSILVLENLWRINPRLVMKSICNLYRCDPNLMNLSRVLDITQDIKELLKSILSLDCYDFTIPLAILAGKRDFLHFDQWMTERIKAIGEPFIVSLVKYLDDCIMKKPSNASESPDKRLEKSYLSPEKLAVVFENLRKCKNLSESVSQQIEAIHKEAISLFPGLITPSNESPEIEDEANRWFQRVFAGEISVSDLIELMKTYKESKDSKQVEIYACMIHNLLDEYKYFVKYPEKELRITGQLFGSIIQNKLVDSLLEKISLKYVFEALKRNGKMLRFGYYALEQFLDRLKEWPNSIELILKMQNFKNTYGDLYNKIQEIGQSVVKPVHLATTQQEPEQPHIPLGSTVESPASVASFPPPANQPVPPAKSQLFPITGQQSPPPSFQPQPYMQPYMYHQNVGRVQPPPGNVGYPWRQKAPMGSVIGSTLVQRTSPELPKYDYSMPSGMPMQPRPSEYHNFMRAVDARDFRSEFQGMPQNPPMSHLPTLLEGPRETITKPVEDIVKPSKQIVEKLTLSMNMMTDAEYMQVKDTALKCIELDPNTLPWLAHMLVERAATQYNNHQLFFKFISATQNRLLASMVLANTTNEIKRILALNKGNENPDDKMKKTIKYLALFVGVITIADNKPILAKDLDLKEILTDGYMNGGITLPVVLVCQILRQAQNSRVFKPNNPWMRAIFSLLVDLAQTPTVAGNFGLRSEITLLYELLKIPQDYYPPAKIIQPKTSAPPQLYKPSPIYQARHPAPLPQVTMPSMVPQIRPPYIPAQYRGASPQPQISGVVINSEIAKILQELDSNYVEYIKKAIDSSVLGILKPVIERSVTIALITTREIVLKDFALDPNGKKLLEAANQMVQCLAGSLAMVTCREPLRMSMGNQLKEVLKKYDLPQKDLEQIVKAICNENLDIGSTYIQKSVIIKARQRVSEDTAIREALEIRNTENSATLIYNTPKQLPDVLKPKKEGLSTVELDVYNELYRVLKENTTSPITDFAMQQESEPKGKYRIVESLQALHKMVEGDAYSNAEATSAMLTRIKQDIQEIERVQKLLDQVSREVFQYFAKYMINDDKKIKEKARVYLSVLFFLSEPHKSLPLIITEELLKNSPEEVKYNHDLVAALFHNSLINVSTYDFELSVAIRNTASMPPESSKNLITFVSNLVLDLVLSKKILQPSQLTSTFMELNSIRKTPYAQSNEAFLTMLSSLSPNEKNPKPVAAQLFEEWVTLNQDQTQEQLQAYFIKLTSHLSSDERFVIFFKGALEAAIQQALFSTVATSSNENALVQNYSDRLNFRVIDSILKLLFTLLPYRLQMCSKYFTNFMMALCGVMITEYTEKPLQFNQRTYYRFFIIILQSLKKHEFKMLPHNEMLHRIALTLYDVAPRRCAGFTFAWLDLISHRNFMADILGSKREEKHLVRRFVMLLCDMYEFLRIPVPSNDQANLSRLCLYLEAVTRITLILVHDFPDFIAQHCFDLAGHLPEQSLHLRNIIFSAIPLNVKAPDPKLGFSIDKSSEQRTPPSILSDYKQLATYRGIKDDIDKYMITANPSLLVDVCNKLMSPELGPRMKRLGLEIFHAMVLYLAEVGIAYEPPKKELGITPILLAILPKLDLQAREQLINAMFNEVRYPNSYTQYFATFLLQLMEVGSIVLVQEQVFRILLERRLTHPPVPWGINAMFSELIQNPKYDLANKSFVKGYKEIEVIIFGKKESEQVKKE